MFAASGDTSRCLSAECAFSTSPFTVQMYRWRRVTVAHRSIRT
jgi:hypothetical protein